MTLKHFDPDHFEDRVVADDLSADELQQFLEAAGIPTSYRPGRVFPLGIIVNDGVRVSFDVKPDAFGGLASALTERTAGGVRSWRVFPLGIVAPERFRVEVDLGRPLAERR
jgi:hypothetical protein